MRVDAPSVLTHVCAGALVLVDAEGAVGRVRVAVQTFANVTARSVAASGDKKKVNYGGNICDQSSTFIALTRIQNRFA